VADYTKLARDRTKGATIGIFICCLHIAYKYIYIWNKIYLVRGAPTSIQRNEMTDSKHQSSTKHNNSRVRSLERARQSVADCLVRAAPTCITRIEMKEWKHQIPAKQLLGCSRSYSPGTSSAWASIACFCSAESAQSFFQVLCKAAYACASSSAMLTHCSAAALRVVARA
jgi:hypothetical protein